jgi:dTDP-3-amino-3,4,6-trideoxy-alpha-D-glucose transaminase
VVRCADRDRIQASLARSGVETLIHYPVPPHRSGVYRDACNGFSLPVADQLAAEVLSLPIGPHLSDGQVDTVIEAIRRAISD